MWPVCPLTADTAEAADNAPVEEAEGGGHEAAEGGDGEEREWNAEKGVEDGGHTTPCRLGRDVTVP